MSKITKDFLMVTFFLSVVSWGTCIVGGMKGVLVSENLILNLLYLLGGWSPTIASFFVLKKHHQVKGFGEWIKNVFDFKQSPFSYLLVIVFGVIYIVPQCLISGFETGMSFVAVLIMLPLMIIGGGLEEAGWRYVLQPELQKKYSFVVSTAIVSVIWWLWHLPLFFITESGQYGSNYFVFGIGIAGVSFALACIKKVTESVWLCVLLHCLLNLLPVVFSVSESLAGNLVISVLLIGVSCFITGFQKSSDIKEIC